MTCNHKPAGKCSIEGCEKSRKPKGICKICGQRTFKNHCRSHMSDGTPIPHTRGKQTTKRVRERLAEIRAKRKAQIDEIITGKITL